MSNLINRHYRSDPSFHRHQITQVLPEFFQEQYPRLIQFLEKYYEYTGEDGSISFNEQVHHLFGIRDISDSEMYTLDLLIEELSDGLQSSSFYQNPRLMARLLSNFYRAKGTGISVEQFFKAFFGEGVEISYPKRDIFILNDSPGGSLIGPKSLHFIQDNKKYQILSILLKTSMSLSDYEILYKKMVHPAGFYLAASVETQGIADLDLKAGPTTDPLEIPNYAILLQGLPLSSGTVPKYSLLTMEENDPVDRRNQTEKNTGEGPVVSSLETLEKFEDTTLEEIVGDYITVDEWAGAKSSRLDDLDFDLSSDNETLDADDHL